MSAFPASLSSIDDLRTHYRAPSRIVIDKVTDTIDDACRRFLARSSFCLVGTADADGNQDVSPRGGPAGFARVLDDRRLVLPDLNGNNRLDTLENIIHSPRIALLFIIPGLGETLRMNGRAWVTVDDDILDGFTDQFRRPASAIGVEVAEAYIHCAKAFTRGAMWEPDQWPSTDERPSVGQILVDHTGAAGTVTAEQVEASLADSYAADLAADLAADRPEG